MCNKNLQMIGINVNDETLTKEKHEVGLGNIDYASTTSSGDIICGLAKMDVDTCDLIPDPILHWKAGTRWGLEEACSVPHAYATVSLCLEHLQQKEISN